MTISSITTKIAVAIAAIVLINRGAFAAGPDGGPPGPKISDTALPRVAPTPADQAVHTFTVHPGLHVELVASEPLIQSPVAMCFDEDGNLYVVEMIGYPDRQESKLGRIVRLQSTRRDGHYDKSTVFADDLPWPTGVFYYDGGIFVTATPDIIYLKDTKGTGIADERKVLFTGFGSTTNPLNVQGLVNNLVWGLDDRIHGATSFNGGIVTRPGSKEAGINLRSRDFSFDPRQFDLRAEDGGGQNGLSFDPFGRKYVCMNSKAVETFLYDSRYGKRNPLYPMPPSLEDVVTTGMDVYRISPEEAWRVLRTQWRMAGEVTGPVEGGGRASGYFTGVSGITIYTGNALPAEFQGNAFIGEVAGNLVHREVIEPVGVSVVAHRAADEAKDEFLASKDIWFRPVQLANGPDGALYVIDMYREVIEHPWSLPESIKGHLDLHSGAERGRIWRIVPDGFKAPPMPALSHASSADLVALLDDSNGWQRQNAGRLLYERKDASAVGPLERLMTSGRLAAGRLAALYALSGQHALKSDDLLKALSDADAHVRENAVLLCEPLLRGPDCPPTIWTRLQKMAADPAITVRYQLAFTLGESKLPEKVDALTEIAKHNIADSGVRAAILSSLAGNESLMFAKLAEIPEIKRNIAGQEFLADLARLVALAHKPEEIDQVTRVIKAEDSRGNLQSAFALADALESGAQSVPAAERPKLEFSDLMAKARTLAASDTSDPPTRIVAIRLLAHDIEPTTFDSLINLIKPSESQEIQLAAISSLDRLGGAQLGPRLIKRWPTLSPRLRSDVLSVLLKRPDRAKALLVAIQKGSLRAADLSTSQSAFLRRHRDASVRELAGKVLVPNSRGREEVVQAYMPALQLKGDADKGRLIYEQRCISCHRLGGEGSAVGPDLVTVRNAGKEKTLINIIDPSREVAPNFVAYQVETRSGESLVGILSSETATSVTIRQAFGKDTTVLRTDVRRLESQKMSLMPEGLEQGLSSQDFANLLEFIMTAPAQLPPAGPGH